MKSNTLLLIIVLLSFLLTSCTAVTLGKRNNTEESSKSNETIRIITGSNNETTTDLTEVSSSAFTEPATETLVETTVESSNMVFENSSVVTTDAPAIVNPDDSYAGKWVSYPAAASGNVVISNLNDKAVTFSLFIYKGFSIEATAIKYDNRFLFGEGISPDLRYDFYDSSFYKECKVSGSIVLAENKVEFIFDDPILNGMDVTFNIKYSSCMKYQETVNECLTVLDNSCWKNATEHPTDIVRYRWSSDASDKVWLDNAKPYATENSLIYSILGRSNYLSVVVRVVYDREADDWFAADVFYAHNDGRVLQGDELKAFMLNHGKTDFILSADDVDLLEYFK